MFTLSVLLVPQSITGHVRQFFTSLLVPVSKSAEVRRDRGPTYQPRKDASGPQQADSDLRARLIESRLEVMKLRSMLNMREELQRLDTRRLPYMYLTRIQSIGDTNPWRKTIVIDRGHGNTGSKPRIIEGLAVTYGRQLIGRVHEVGRRTSRVQLVTDPNFSMRVIALPPNANLERDSEEYDRPKVYLSKRTGILEGTGSRTMDLNHILASVSVEKDWEVISAGGRGNPMPRGLLLGRVDKVSDQYGQFLRISVKPSVNIEKIRNLMVLRPRRTRNSTGPNQ